MALLNIKINFLVVVIASILNSATVNGRVISPRANTVKAQNGDIYDCVNFYEQPAFQHPLLKNHSFNPKMEPSFRPKRIDLETETKNTNDSYFGLKDGGCPFGTVPIRRVTKDHRDRASKFYSDLVNLSITPNQLPTDSAYRWAILQSKSGSPNYYGVGAKLGLIVAAAFDGQYTSAQCIIQNGPDYIQFGATRNPELYGDHLTRMFIRTEAGTTHCYNTDCSGFVVVRTDIPLDAILFEQSTPHKFVTLDLTVYREPESGNWWLTIGDDLTQIGFWPANTLSNLANFGTYIECGGESYSQPGIPHLRVDQDIGLGCKPLDNLQFDAYVKKFVTVNDKLQEVHAQDTEIFVTNDNYGVLDKGIIDKDWGHTFLYGGPRPGL